MKTSIFRRGISGLLAVLMTFTALMGIGTTTAFAASTAGETAESYSVGFPRDGDANLDYSGTWGHDELHYMNGWTSGEATWMTTLHTIGSFDGQACYTIEKSTPLGAPEEVMQAAKLLGAPKEACSVRCPFWGRLKGLKAMP